MSSIEQLQKLVEKDLMAVNEAIKSNLQSTEPLIRQLGAHIISGGGKRIRPLVVVLGANVFSYTGSVHIDLAAAMEYFHTATLLHDDVIDESHLRRGRETANSIWGSKASILVGDYLFTRAFQLMLRAKQIPVLQVLADASNTITRGEVMQLSHCQNPEVTEAQYMQVIYEKTAILFAAAAKLGALLTEQSDEMVQSMHDYGVHLGNAFQIIDDVLDYQSDDKTLGKNIGDDLAEGKLTLPLIYAMKASNAEDQLFIKNTIQAADITQLPKLLEIIKRTEANEACYRAASVEVDKACNALQAIPASSYRDALMSLAQCSIARMS